MKTNQFQRGRFLKALSRQPSPDQAYVKGRSSAEGPMQATPWKKKKKKKTNQIKKWAEDLRKHFFWRRHTDGQQVHEKVFSITN